LSGWLKPEFQTEKAEVFTEDRYECYRVGTELHMGGRRCEEAPRRRDTPWKTTLSYKALINVVLTELSILW
jgi:hypothetical protein